jgi:shikimate dehydrogenase
MITYVKEIEKIIRNKINLSEAEIKQLDNKDNSSKKLYAVFGKNISYSLSPIMHNSIFSKMNMNCEYTIIDKEIEECIKWIKEKGSGANVTIPHKVAVIDYLDVISDDAKEVGAVNTINKNSEGKLEGYNTDYIAIRDLLSGHIGKVVVFGSGGATRAALYALKGRDITIISRNPDETREKYSDFDVKISGYDNALEIVRNSDVIINASPSVPEIAEAVTDKHVIFEMKYNPLDTGLNKIALEKNAIIIHGLEMLAIQAAESQKIWFGKRADSDFMLSVALDEITKNNNI